MAGVAPGGLFLTRLPTGQVTFLPNVIDGELVRVRVDASGKRATLLEVVEPSPHRVEPPCSIAKSCGGCDFMHIAPQHRSELHVQMVSELLSRALGGCPTPRVWHPTEPLRYRTRARLSWAKERGKLKLGFFARHSRTLVEAPDCLVLDARLVEAARACAGWLSLESGSGEVALALGRTRDLVLPVIDIGLSQDPRPELLATLDAACQRGELAGARVLLAAAKRPLSFGDPRAVQTGFDGGLVLLPPGGFAQPSDAGAACLAQRVAELAEATGQAVLELFSGSGTLSIALASGARTFTSVEQDPDAVACAKLNLAARGLSGKLRVGDAEATSVPAATDLVVLDPPRTGARGAVREIAKAKPKRVLYVSCDPPTLARDLTLLSAAGYRAAQVELVDLFPQTSHTETLVMLERGAAARSGRA